MSRPGGVELLVIERDGHVLLSSRMTPGFFVAAADKNAAAARYLGLLKQLGPMPMAMTASASASAAQREATTDTATPRAMYLGFAFDANFGDRWMYRVLAARMPVRFVHPVTLEEQWRKIVPRGHYELAMLGGGTLINQQPQFYQDALGAVTAGLPAVCFGSGVGEVERWGDHRAAWVDLLRHFAFVGVRGPHSHQALAAAGLGNHVVTGDPCLLDQWTTPAPGPALSPAAPLRLWLDLSFGGQETETTVLFRYELLVLLAALERTGAITLSLFTSWNAYLPWIDEQMAGVFGSKRPILVLNDDNRDQITRDRIDVAVAYRLHAAAALLLAGIPTLVVRYEAKCLDFLAQLGLDDLVVAPDAAGTQQLYDVLGTDPHTFIAEQRMRIPAAVAQAKAHAEHHFADFLAAIDRACPRPHHS